MFFLKQDAAQIELHVRSSAPKIGCLFHFWGRKDPLFIPLFHTNSQEIHEFDNSEKSVKFMMGLLEKRDGGVQDCMPVGSSGKGYVLANALLALPTEGG